MALTAEIAAWIGTVTGARVVGERPLYAWRPGAPQLIELDDGRRMVLRQAPDHQGRRDGYARESAAMILAEEHGVPAPRLVAVDVDGSVARHPTLLMTLASGASRIPVTASAERLEALGAAAARTASVRTGPTDDLPELTGPIDIGWAAAWRQLAVRWETATEADRQTMIKDLSTVTGWEPEAAREAIPKPFGGRSHRMEEAEEILGRQPVPAGETVLVHGDLWQGNTLWESDRLTAMIDWDAAGVGHAGIDLSCARHDAVLFFGAEAAAPVLAGWQREAGVRPDPQTTAYWDVRAALNTPADMTEGMGGSDHYGRPDLEPTTVTARRDEFLETALRVLG